MLKTLGGDQRADWKSHLNKVVHAYNCTKHDTTGLAPLYMLFGRSPRLSLDLVFGLGETEDQLSHRGYVAKARKGLQEAFEIAKKMWKKQTMVQRDSMIGESSAQYSNQVTEF